MPREQSPVDAAAASEDRVVRARQVSVAAVREVAEEAADQVVEDIR